MEYLSVDKKWTFSLILKYFYQLLFWYCVLLCIPVCACAMSRAQKNAVNSFGKYFYVENVDNFTSVLIYLEKWQFRVLRGGGNILKEFHISAYIRAIFLK